MKRKGKVKIEVKANLTPDSMNKKNLLPAFIQLFRPCY